MKSVKIRRKRNEKHKVENEEDYKRKEIWTGRIFVEKSWKNIENETNETRYFVERDRNWSDMAKEKMKQKDFPGNKKNTKREN